MRLPASRRLSPATAALAALLVMGTAACGASGGDDTSVRTAQTTTTTGSAATKTTTSGAVGAPETTSTTAGGGTGANGRQAYVDALVTNFNTGQDLEIFKAGQVECLANGFLDIIGLEKLQAADVSPQTFAESSDLPPEVGIDEAKANRLYDQFDACGIDLASAMAKVFQAGGKGLTAAQQACFDKVVTDDSLRASFVADFLGKSLEQDPLDEASTCFRSN